MSENKEMVNHPEHYTREGAMECIDEMLLLFGLEETKAFCKLNAWKYRYRAMGKNGEQDLKKSDWYLNKYKELSNNFISMKDYCISVTDDDINQNTIKLNKN